MTVAAIGWLTSWAIEADQLPHRGDAIGVREFHLRLALATLAVRGAWASARLRSVKSSTKATPSSCVPSKATAPISTGTRLPSFRKYSFSNGLARPDRLQVGQPLFGGGAPFGGCHVRPAHSTRDKILAAVSHHVEKGVVGVEEPPLEIEDDDADDVGVEQTPDLLIALCEIVVELDVLLGRFSSPSRFEPCERQRRPC